MSEAPALPPGRAVLLVSDDPFESGYVASVLAARGIAVVGPYADGTSALCVLDTGHVSAAVTSCRSNGGMGDALSHELAARDVPHLTLVGAKEVSSRDGCLTLAKPFAGHQVADWVVRVLEQPATATVPPEAAQLAATGSPA